MCRLSLQLYLGVGGSGGVQIRNRPFFLQEVEKKSPVCSNWSLFDETTFLLGFRGSADHQEQAGDGVSAPLAATAALKWTKGFGEHVKTERVFNSLIL